MFRPMRRTDRAISREEAYELLKNGEYGILGTIELNGYPCGTPFNYAVDGNYIYVHFAITGNVFENIQNNNKVSFTYVGKTELLPEEFVTNYASVMVFGKAKIADDEEKRHGLMLLLKKYSPMFMKPGIEHIEEDFNNANVLKIEIEHITGKSRRG